MSPTPAKPAPAIRRCHGLKFSWWVVGALAVAFVVLAALAQGTNTLDIDLRVSEWVQRWDGAIARSIAKLGNFLGDRVFAVSLLIVAVVVLGATRQVRDLWFVVLITAGRLAALPLKGFFDSPRPNASQVEVAGFFSDFGFPSGHVLTSALTLGAIAFLLACRTPRRDLRLALLAMWFAGVSLTAYARIWYGAHWFTDTVGGALVGAAIVLVAANLSALVMAHRTRARQPTPGRTPAP